MVYILHGLSVMFLGHNLSRLVGNRSRPVSYGGTWEWNVDGLEFHRYGRKELRYACAFMTTL